MFKRILARVNVRVMVKRISFGMRSDLVSLIKVFFFSFENLVTVRRTFFFLTMKLWPIILQIPVVFL